jgi:hypothetical protein
MTATITALAAFRSLNSSDTLAAKRLDRQGQPRTSGRPPVPEMISQSLMRIAIFKAWPKRSSVRAYPEGGLMKHEESTPAEKQAFAASFPPSMSLEQKLLLTVFFSCTAGRDRTIKETYGELAVLCGMELPDFFITLLELKNAGIITDDSRGLRINRGAIKNAKAIDERAATAAKRVRGRRSK